MENVEKVEEQEMQSSERIFRGTVIGWLLFAIPLIYIFWDLKDTPIDNILNLEAWIYSIPGALFGAIVGILLNNKENKGESATAKNEETLESKIKGLKNLLDEGLLTQEEFDEQKRKILNN